MKHIVDEFRTLKSLLPDLINISGYRNDHIAKKLGLTPQRFSERKKKQNWSDEEVHCIIGIIENDETDDYLLLKILESTPRGETMDYNTLKKKMGWK